MRGHRDWHRGGVPLLRNQPFRITATFGGLQTRGPEFLATNGPTGFGALGCFRADLQVLAVKDFAITSLGI